MPDGSYIKVYQSKTIMKTLNPSWDKFHMRIWDLCGKDMTQDIKVECFDWDKYSSDDLIGEATFSLEKVISAGASKSIELIHPKLKSKKKYKNSGKLVFESAKLIKVPTFIEYLRGGLEINLMVAIDFTGSNGNPNLSTSLHYVGDSENDNAYMKAIRSVGSILAAYDKDQKISAYGFGAELPDGKISHCFNLNGDKFNSEVNGIEGVMSAYKQSLTKVKLWGPTHFSQVIKNTSYVAQCEMGDRPYKYYVLLILTDGEIDDMKDTIDAIVKASNSYPMSIVITGIGNADFTNMNRLDGDDSSLKSSDGKEAQRDIVQFVPFNRFYDCPQMLAQETLAEIPRQISEYMVMKGLLHVKKGNNNIIFDSLFFISFLFNSHLFLWMKMAFLLMGLCLSQLPLMFLLLSLLVETRFFLLLLQNKENALSREFLFLLIYYYYIIIIHKCDSSKALKCIIKQRETIRSPESVGIKVFDIWISIYNSFLFFSTLKRRIKSNQKEEKKKTDTCTLTNSPTNSPTVK